MGKILSAYITPHAPILIPEIGRERQKDIETTQNALWKIAKDIAAQKPTTVIVITPHGVSLSDALCITTTTHIKGDFKSFGNHTLQYQFENDLPLVESFLQQATEAHFPLVALDKNTPFQRSRDPVLDHGALVPLYFIQKMLPSFKLVHLSMGFLEATDLLAFGGLIKKSVLNANAQCVLIASGDLSHKLTHSGPYGYHPSGKVFDDQIVGILRNGDLMKLTCMDEHLVEEAAQCGLRSFITLTGALYEPTVKSEVLSYEGPFGIGYCVAKIENGQG